MPVITGEGVKIPLGDVSKPLLVAGVGRIYHELRERRIAVKCSVRGRAVVDFVNDANQKIKDGLQLPVGYHTAWSGSFENADRASRQLMIIIPICLLTIILILYAWFKNWYYVGLVLLEIPFAAVGGIFLLRLFGLNFSISAASGGIVLIGVTLLTGMMYIGEYIHLQDAWKALLEKGKSILISSGVAIIGLIPAAFSTGIGSETAKPFAVIILGGLITSLFCSLILLPAITYLIFNRHTVKN